MKKIVLLSFLFLYSCSKSSSDDATTTPTNLKNDLKLVKKIEQFNSNEGTNCNCILTMTETITYQNNQALKSNTESKYSNGKISNHSSDIFYNSNGLLNTVKSYQDGIQNYQYNFTTSNNKITSRTTIDYTTKFYYNTNDKLSKIEYYEPNGTNIKNAIDFEYDTNLNLTKETWSNGNIVTYVYDNNQPSNKGVFYFTNDINKQMFEIPTKYPIQKKESPSNKITNYKHTFNSSGYLEKTIENYNNKITTTYFFYE